MRVELGYVVNHYESPQVHDNFQISTVEHGYGSLFIRGRRYDVAADTSVIIPPGEKHSGHLTGTDGRLLRQTMYFDPTYLDALVATVQDTHPSQMLVMLPIASNTMLTTQIRRTIQTFQNESDLLSRESVVLDTIAALLHHTGRNPSLLPVLRREHTAVKKLCRYIESNAAEKLSLDELAGFAALNKFYLLRVFQYETGLTPAAYQTHVRLRLAKQMLQAGVEAHTVALQVGFADQSHLIRVFKRHLGITPGWYQQHIRR